VRRNVSAVLKRLVIPLALLAAVVVAAVTSQQRSTTPVRPAPTRSLQMHTR
jgi:predicted membrane-bound mannosyltransferase